MAKIKLEYIWLDGYLPEPNLRSKVLVKEGDIEKFLDAKKCPQWNFDGSSTQQADGGSSDCLLQPVRTCINPMTDNGVLVLCEVLSPDGTPHPSNHRAFEDDPELWIGFEQEYTLIDPETSRPLGFPTDGYPAPQGPYYCSVGAQNSFGREISEEHLDACIEAGLNNEGTNAEVMAGQWEFQVFAKGGHEVCDQLQLARYILLRIAEQYGVVVSLHPKPVTGDWNGSGMHCNFSTKAMRSKKDGGGKELVDAICEALGKVHEEHIAVYGSDNDMRLTGLHETQSIDSFSYGVSDRGASIRIPVTTAQDDYIGRLEDRRPASNADPYRITGRLLETLSTVK